MLNERLQEEVRLFFARKPGALPLFEAFEQRLAAELVDFSVKVSKSQISFANRYNFAFVSLLPVRRARERPANYIVVTFGLAHRVDSPRIDVATEAYPNRWTHHVLICEPRELDDELMGWVRAAYDFSAAK